jgi:hypothetical protein
MRVIRAYFRVPQSRTAFFGVFKAVSKQFFFEKKNQKTFAPLRVYVEQTEPHRKNQSFFASFCSQKEGLPALSVKIYFPRLPCTPA